jgi:hypothetical protein
MQKISIQGKLRPLTGIILFGVLMAFMVFAAAPLQINLGIPGLILTEIGFLALAIGYCLITGIKFKEAFPVKKIKLKELFGCILIVLGFYPVELLLVILTAVVFPGSVDEVGDITSFLYDGLSYPLAILVVALVPAICEEAIHRGAILSSFRSIKRDWVIVLIMGLLFGINHLSVLRFLMTTVMGLFLSYVVVKRNNIILSMLMHFLNNATSVTIGYLTGSISSAGTGTDYTAALGTYLVLGFLSPIVITLGVMLVNPEGHRKIRFLYAGILSAVMLVSGFAVTAFGNSHNMLLNSTFGYTVTADEEDHSVADFDVNEDRNATVAVVLTNAEGDYAIRIDGDKGSNIINAEVPEGPIRVITYNVGLQADHYTVSVIPGENAVGEKPNIQITIK